MTLSYFQSALFLFLMMGFAVSLPVIAINTQSKLVAGLALLLSSLSVVCATLLTAHMEDLRGKGDDHG